MNEDEKKQAVRDILNKELSQYIPAHELIHAAHQICSAFEDDGTVDELKLEEMHSYLIQFDKPYTPLQTVRIDSIIRNQAAIAFAQIRKLMAPGG